MSSFNWGRNSPWSFSKTSNLYATNKSSDGNLLIWNELLRLHDAIYRLRFYSISLTHTLSLSNSHSNIASIQKNQGDKSHRVIVALISSQSTEFNHILLVSNLHNNGSNFTIPWTEEVPACISWYVIWVKHSNLDVTMMQVSCNL